MLEKINKPILELIEIDLGDRVRSHLFREIALWRLRSLIILL